MTGFFQGDLVANLATLDDKVRMAVLAAAEYTAPQAESYMRANATWTDRTGAARNGLRAQVESSGNRTAIVLYHSVHYGVWLEVRWGGKYAIIEPTMVATGPIFVKAIKALLS